MSTKNKTHVVFRKIGLLKEIFMKPAGCHYDLKFPGIGKVVGKGRLGIEQLGSQSDSSQVKSPAPGPQC